MFTGAMRSLYGKERERGFTLVELLIVILIVGILAAVAVPLYLGYTKDAKSAEGKALAGSAMTALQGCVQAKGAGGTCALADVVGRIGVTAAGLTGDGRWDVVVASLTVSSGTAVPTFSGTIGVSGIAARDTDNIAMAMFPGTWGVVLRCTTISTALPATSTSNEPC